MTFSTVFILGVGRSGTSLIQSMLAAHPQISCLPETAFIRRMVFPGYLQSIFQKHGEMAASRALAQDEYFARTGLDASKVVAQAARRVGLLDAAVYREMLALYAVKDKEWVGDKDPRTVEFLPLLTSFFSDAHVIHVFRDPRDVLASKKKAAWSKKGHVWKHVFANRVQFNIGSKFGPKLFGTRYHEICYEELLAAPEKVLTGLCRELGLEYDDGMLSFGDAARKLVADSEKSWKKETFGPLLTDNQKKWKAQLIPKEIVLTELCCGEALARGGYEKGRQRQRLSLKDWLWVQAGRLLIVLATRPYMTLRNFQMQRACRRVR